MPPTPHPPTPQPSPSPGGIEALLAHREWVRTLARSLVRDASSADDVEQRTWQAALENPPEKTGAVRAWLGSVVRRIVLDNQRRHVRRERRELAVARPEGLPSTADVVARLEIDRAVVNSVAELPEPYRTTLLLRFFDGLPPRDVAARMGVPVETVRARVRRGLERVRVGLDWRHGGERGVWRAALVPLLTGPGGPGSPPAAPEAHPDAPGGGGDPAGTAGAPAGNLAVTVAATVGAIALGVLGGLQLRSLPGADARIGGASMPRGDAVLAARQALDAERAELGRLNAHVDSLRSEAAGLEKRIADVGRMTIAVLASAPAAQASAPIERARFEPPFRFPDYDDALAGVAWDALGDHIAHMIPLLGEIYDDRRHGRSLRPATVGQLQAHNGAVVAIVGPLEESFPGGAENAAITHPAFAATMAAALCHARELPLSSEQITALGRVARDGSDAVARAVDGAARHAFRLSSVIEETEAKLAFAEALRRLLTPEQRVLFGNDSIRDVLGYDLFGPTQMWVGVVETGTFSAGTDVGAVIAAGLTRELELDPAGQDELRQVVNDWFDALPEEHVGPASSRVEELRSAYPVEDIVIAARHMVDLMRRVTQLDLSDAQRESIRDSARVLILRRER